MVHGYHHPPQRVSVPPDGRTSAPQRPARGPRQRPQPTSARRRRCAAGRSSTGRAAGRDRRRSHRRPGCPVSVAPRRAAAPPSSAAVALAALASECAPSAGSPSPATRLPLAADVGFHSIQLEDAIAAIHNATGRDSGPDVSDSIDVAGHIVGNIEVRHRDLRPDRLAGRKLCAIRGREIPTGNPPRPRHARGPLYSRSAHRDSTSRESRRKASSRYAAGNCAPV